MTHPPVHREEQQRCYYLQRVAKKLGVIQFLEKHLSEEEVMDLRAGSAAGYGSPVPETGLS